MILNAAFAATDQQKDMAAQAYMSCLLETAHSLDDETLSEPEVGAGISAACRESFEHMKEVYSRGASEALSTSLSHGFDALQLKSSARAVLLVRASRQPTSGQTGL
jgi:hypothetical protein